MRTKSRNVFIFFLAAVFATAGTASAGSLATAALQKKTTQEFACRVVNLAKKTVNVVVEIIDKDAIVITNSSISVEPGNSRSAVYTGTAIQGYCVVEGKFSKKKLPTAFCVREGSADDCLATVTAPW